MKVDIWMPVYINDYLADTMRLNAKRHGIYFLLMMDYWKHGEIPKDICELSFIARVPEGDKDLDYILENFFTEEGLKYSHKRIDKELDAATSRRESARANGKKGGRPRKEEKTHRFSEGKPTDNQQGNPQESSSSSPSPSSFKGISKEKNMKKESRSFKKPSVQEIEEYCKERGNTITPQYFYDYNEARGWVVGKTKMKDWKACIRTWERNNFNNGKQDNFKAGGVNFEL